MFVRGGRQRDQREREHTLSPKPVKRGLVTVKIEWQSGQFTAHASSNRLLPNYQLISTARHVWEGRLRFTISEGRMVDGRI